jgi:hypothetical protein
MVIQFSEKEPQDRRLFQEQKPRWRPGTKRDLAEMGQEVVDLVQLAPIENVHNCLG